MKILKAFERRTRQIGTEIKQEKKTKQSRTERVIQKKTRHTGCIISKKIKKTKHVIFQTWPITRHTRHHHHHEIVHHEPTIQARRTCTCRPTNKEKLPVLLYIGNRFWQSSLWEITLTLRASKNYVQC